MWLLLKTRERGPGANLGLGISTALVAGLVNVCSVMMFFAFSANVTGHAAALAHDLAHGNWYQVSVVIGWMGMFLLGAFLANVCVTRLGPRSLMLGHGAPLLLQAAGIALVAIYGARRYGETLWETEVLMGALLFTMGMQNGTVASVSNSVIRTTHLTGLFTDLAMELSLLLRPSQSNDAALRIRFKLHAAILAAYIVGGIIGGLLCGAWGFGALYMACAILLGIVIRDLCLAPPLGDASPEPMPEGRARPLR